jgi:hypothetical protein
MNYLLTALISAVFILTACGQNKVQTRNNTNENTVANSAPSETVKKEETECKICEFDFESYKGDLKKEEVNGLLLALNDEYMALATYQQINKDFNDPRPFVNIQQAEARHAERLKTLFDTYKIPIPENNWIGKAPKFQSIAIACQGGVDAEIANRDLYRRLFETTTREEILVVYRALQRASEENHLPAFERCGSGARGNG